MSEGEFKFRIIRGKGGEEEISIKPSKQFKIEEKQVIPQSVTESDLLDITGEQKIEIRKGQEVLKVEFEKEKPEKIIKKPIRLLFLKKFLFLFLIIASTGILVYFFVKNLHFITTNISKLLFKESEIKQNQSSLPNEIKPIISPKKIEIPSLEYGLETSTKNITTTSIPTQITETTTQEVFPTATIATTAATAATALTQEAPSHLKATITLPSTPTPEIRPQSLQTQNLETKLEPPSLKSEDIKNVIKEEIPAQKGEIPKDIGVFPSIEISLKELNTDGLKIAWLNAIKIQKEAGNIYEIKFKYNDERIPLNIISNYFIKPSFIESRHIQEFIKTFRDYKILFYYTYTRKYPVLVFKIENDSFVITFLRLWDKETLTRDMYNLYLGLPKGKLIRNFTITEKFEDIKYNIAYYDNDYKLIWTVYNNYLVFSTSLSAFKYIIKKLK